MSSQRAGIRFYHPWFFWIGTLLVVAGVLGHIPMFVRAAPMNFHMAGMKMGTLMTIAMYVIIVGTAMVSYALYPPKRYRKASQSDAYRYASLRAMDDAPLSAEHWKLIGVLIVALIVDVMKPATLAFVVPGSKTEYGLSSAQASLMPLAGIVGTTLGSLLWGHLGDVIGRRASILLAAIVFIGTAICGAMPSYAWNVFMCFMMGLGAGGMLPIAFSLLAEIIPARHRAWLTVLVGGVGTVGGYLAASAASALLEPTYTWRILWFIGLPTGMLLLFLNRYIPESPRYLLMHGNSEEANRVMALFSLRQQAQSSPASMGLETPMQTPAQDNRAAEPVSNKAIGNFWGLFRFPFAGVTMSLSVYATAWGLVNFGFLLWLPTNLRAIPDVAAPDAVLAKSALLAFAATPLIAWLYHTWSSKKTLVLFAMLTAISLISFAVLGADVASRQWLLYTVLVGLIFSSSAVIALLSPYAAEIYPSHIRSTGSGWSAACSKGAGIVTLSGAYFGLIPGIATGAWIVIIPTVFAALLLGLNGMETRGKVLEDIHRGDRS